MTHVRCPHCGRFRSPEGWVEPQRYMVLLALDDKEPPRPDKVKREVCDECAQR